MNDDEDDMLCCCDGMNGAGRLESAEDIDECGKSGINPGCIFRPFTTMGRRAIPPAINGLQR